METAYYLIVERLLPGGRRLRTLDDYDSPDRLVADAADHASGEYPASGRVRPVGALELSFDRTGALLDARPVEDLTGKVHSELMSRPAWRRCQAALQRWANRRD
jgi:hypothetical protein